MLRHRANLSRRIDRNANDQPIALIFPPRPIDGKIVMFVWSSTIARESGIVIAAERKGIVQSGRKFG